MRSDRHRHQAQHMHDHMLGQRQRLQVHNAPGTGHSPHLGFDSAAGALPTADGHLRCRQALQLTWQLTRPATTYYSRPPVSLWPQCMHAVGLHLHWAHVLQRSHVVLCMWRTGQVVMDDADLLRADLFQRGWRRPGWVPP